MERQLQNQQLLSLLQGIHSDFSQAPLPRVWRCVLWTMLCLQSCDRWNLEEGKLPLQLKLLQIRINTYLLYFGFARFLSPAYPVTRELWEETSSSPLS